LIHPSIPRKAGSCQPSPRTIRIGGIEVSIQKDGKIVVLGYSNNSKNEDLLLTRYTHDGVPDRSSGIGALSFMMGVVMTKASDLNSRRTFDKTGDVDPGFAMDGHLIWNGPGNVTDYGQGIALQPDGKIIVTGFTHHGENEDLLLMRILP
jgi:uncharacterized delta-60 repeat protein